MCQNNEATPYDFSADISAMDFPTLKKALTTIRTLLKVFGQADVARLETLAAVFVGDVSLLKLEQLLTQFGQGNFDTLPKVAVCSRSKLEGSRASYFADCNTLYLATDFLSEATESQIFAVLLEAVTSAINARTVPFVFSPTDTHSSK